MIGKLCLAFAAMALTCPLVAQEGNNNPVTSLPHTLNSPVGKIPSVPQTPQEVLLLFAGSAANDHTLLTLNNNHVKDLEVRATVYTASGQETVLPVFNLLPRESRIVDLENALHASGLSSQQLGWLKLSYTGVFLGLGAQLTLYGNNQSVGVDSPRSLSADFISQSRSAAFLMPEGASARITLSNTSNDNTLITLHCGLFSREVSIAAFNTDIEVLSKSDINPQQFPITEAASCDITSDSAASTLRVVGVVSGAHGYAAPIRFYDPATSTFPSLTAVGVDTSAETIAVLHNISDEPVRYTPILAEATLDEPRKITLPTEALQPHSDKVINLTRALNSLRTKGSICQHTTLQSQAPDGAFVGSLTQIFHEDDLIEDIPLRTANRAGNAAGAYPLRWGRDYTNLVTVTNTSSETLVARSVITVADVSYVPAPRTIPPGRTTIYDVDQMRKEQIKDINGKVIPLASDYGKFMWFDSNFGSKKGLMGRN